MTKKVPLTSFRGVVQILDLLEFQVLAAARGIDAYYGFAQEKQDWDQEQVYFAVYQLTKSGILVRNGKRLEIQPPVSDYINCMIKSPCLLVADTGGFGLPRQCFYRHDGMVAALENSTTDRGRICMWGMDEEEFIRHLSDLNQLPEARIKEDIGYFDFLGYWREHIEQELWELLETGLEADTSRLLECGQVHTAFSLRDKGDGRLLKRLLILDTPMEYCMATQEQKQNRYVQYTLKKAAETLAEWAK